MTNKEFDSTVGEACQQILPPGWGFYVFAIPPFEPGNPVKCKWTSNMKPADISEFMKGFITQFSATNDKN